MSSRQRLALAGTLVFVSAAIGFLAVDFFETKPVPTVGPSASAAGPSAAEPSAAANPSPAGTPVSSSIDVNFTDLPVIPVDPITQRIEIQDPRFVDATAAPHYIDDRTIAFAYDVTRSHIVALDRKSRAYEIIYQAPIGVFINSLVGIDRQLFWVEYPRRLQDNMPWQMKTMSLDDRRVRVFRQGVAEDQMLPPVFQVYRDRLTWLDKKIVDHVVVNGAYVYDPSTGKTDEIASAKLDEHDKNRRQGLFYIIQRPVEDGMLIQQSVFERQAQGESLKTYELVHYPYDPGAKPLSIARYTDSNLVDFTADRRWFVLCETGKVKVIDRATGAIRYEFVDTYNGRPLELSFDSPIISGEKLYFRRDMGIIFQLDLDTGKLFKVLDTSELVTKIMNSDGHFGFAILDMAKGRFEFLLIDEHPPTVGS